MFQWESGPGCYVETFIRSQSATPFRLPFRLLPNSNEVNVDILAVNTGPYQITTQGLPPPNPTTGFATFFYIEIVPNQTVNR